MWEMIEQMIDPVRPCMVENNKSQLVRAALVALLSICLVGYMFTGAPLVNAQEEEAPTTDERLENIEKILAELSEDLDNLHETYVSREILGYEIYSLKTELSALESTMDSDLAALRIEMSALKTNTETRFTSVEKRLDMIWGNLQIVLGAILGTFIVTIISFIMQSRSITRVMEKLPLQAESE